MNNFCTSVQILWPRHPARLKHLLLITKLILLTCVLFLATQAQGGNFPQDFGAAMELYNARKIEEAKSAFLKLSETGPTQEAIDQSLHYAATCASWGKNHEEATAIAARIKNKYQRTLCMMSVLSSQYQFTDVLKLTQDENFEQWPDTLSYDAFSIRATAYARTGNVEQADKDFHAALGQTISDFKKGQIYFRLGNLFSEKKPPDPRGMDAYAEIYKLQAGPTLLCNAAICRAKLFAAQGNREQALKEMDRLKELKKQPHWSFAQNGYAEIFAILGAKEESQARYKAIIDSTNPPADLLEIAKSHLNTASKP